MKYSYYIGFRLPSRLSDQIVAIQKRLRDPIETREPLEPHITLLPPPAVTTIAPNELVPQVKAATKHTLPLTITLTSITTLGGHAVALQVESDEIYELQRELVALLPFAAGLTYYPDPTFLPHVSIVQAVRGKKLPSKLIGQYREELEPLIPATFTARHITIFHHRGPRKYEAEKI
jgi:2'-5' RNA ligase